MPGEAGIGKTSLVHAFLAAAAGRARVLAGSCEDLLTPRALGPLRDAARSAAGGPLAAALSPRADPDLVFTAACDELASPPSPAILVIEDAHWADGATLDVLRYLGTRVQDLPAVLLVTYRDDALTRDHPLRGVLGMLGSAAATRLRLTRLTLKAVRQMAAATNVDPGELFRLTGGNPFFVTEILANPGAMVPPTVVDAVLARVGTLSQEAQGALDRLAVVPSGAEVSLLRVLVGDLAPIAEAERAGVVEVRGDVVAFRHELARRAVAESLPASVRLELNAEVLRALLTRPDSDLFRVLHHAVEAGDDDAVITHGIAAAREASRVGAHRQAAACYDQVLARGHRLPTARRAVLGEAYSWALSNSNQLHAAAAAAATAAELWQQDGDVRCLVRALVTLSRQQWLTEHTAAARRPAERAFELARPFGDGYQNALAMLNLGGLLILVDQEEDGLPYLDEALGIAERCGAASVAALCHNYRGSALLQLGDLSGCGELLRSMAQAAALGNHEYVMRAYYNLIEGLWRLGDYRGALSYIEQAENFGRDRDFRVYGYMFAARRCRLALMRGQWAAAEAGLRELLDGQDDPGMIGRETVPVLARVLVRQGSADAPEWLAIAARHAARADVLEWLVPTGLAHIEHAWLTGDREQAGRYPGVAAGAHGSSWHPRPAWGTAGVPAPARLSGRALPGLSRAIRRRAARRLARSGGCVAPRRGPVRARRRACRVGPGRARPQGSDDPGRSRRQARGDHRPQPSAGPGCHPAAAPAAAGHADQPGGIDRSPARDPAAGRDRALEHGDRAPAGGIAPDRGPPCRRHLEQAWRAHQARGGGPGRRIRAQSF